MTGPATDNEVGQVYITGGLGLPAHNAMRDAPGLVDVVQQALAQWAAGNDQSAGVSRLSAGRAARSGISALSTS